ncbi:serine/threonine protein phosphatase, partial [Streptomyces lavendulae]
MTEYPTSQEGPQPAVASGGGTDEPGHGKAPIAAAEAVRTHAQTPAADLPRPRGAAGSGGPQGARTSGHDAADTGPAGARARDGEAARNA